MFSSTTTELSISRDKRKRQPAENHAVDGRSTELQNEKCRAHRERDGEEHRHGRPHAAQKHQNHDAGEEQADTAFMEQCFDRRAHEPRLIENHAGLHRRGHVDQVSKVCRTPSTTAMVLESPPCFITGR